MPTAERRLAHVLTVAELVPSFIRSQEAGNKSPKTVSNYQDALRQFGKFLDDERMPQAIESVSREHVETFITHILCKHKPNTALSRFKALKLFFNWCVEEGELHETASPMRHVKAPTVPETPVEVLTDSQLALLFKACEGKDFASRRDAAIIRLFLESGMRLGELARLAVNDVNLDARVAAVLGKGRKPRLVKFGKVARMALDRYLRVRLRHRDADLCSTSWSRPSPPLASVCRRRPSFPFPPPDLGSLLALAAHRA